MASLAYPQNRCPCNACGEWFPLDEFRHRAGGGIYRTCRKCHSRQRSAQQCRQRARRKRKQLTDAARSINRSRNERELRGAANALLAICGGSYHQFAQTFIAEFNRARPGSQMRTSMLLAAGRILLLDAADRDKELDEIANLSDEELRLLADQCPRS